MLTIVPKKAKCSIEWTSRDEVEREQPATMTCELTSDGALVYATVSAKSDDGSTFTIAVPADAIATAARLLQDSPQITAAANTEEMLHVAKSVLVRELHTALEMVTK